MQPRELPSLPSVTTDPSCKKNYLMMQVGRPLPYLALGVNSLEKLNFQYKRKSLFVFIESTSWCFTKSPAYIGGYILYSSI